MTTLRTHSLCRLCRSTLLSSPIRSTLPLVIRRSVIPTATSSSPIRSISLLSSRPRPSTSLSSWMSMPGLSRGMTLQAQPPSSPPEDFEPVEQGDDTITLTENAIKQITRAQEKACNPSLALRVAVESGGCHGYQYKMEVTDRVQEDDYLFQPPSSSARLLIDSASLPLISGSTIDYATELIGSSFRVQGNPHASDKGGCGCGVSWELKE